MERSETVALNRVGPPEKARERKTTGQQREASAQDTRQQGGQWLLPAQHHQPAVQKMPCTSPRSRTYSS